MGTTRRRLLTVGGLSAVMAIGLASPSAARDWTAAETANVKVVNDFSVAWATGDANRITAYLADDCVVRFYRPRSLSRDGSP